MDELPLTAEVLITAYTHGIFPMDVEGRVEWFSPDPRAIIELDEFHISKNLRRRYQSGRFDIRINTAFAEVIKACSEREEGTWISGEIMEAYIRLHKLGLAHSVESWANDQLAGGLYGVSIGGAFFGESMFHYQTDASKVTLVALVERMRKRGFDLLDIQFITEHLQQFGAKEISREEYLQRLEKALQINASFVG